MTELTSITYFEDTAYWIFSYHNNKILVINLIINISTDSNKTYNHKIPNPSMTDKKRDNGIIAMNDPLTSNWFPSAAELVLLEELDTLVFFEVKSKVVVLNEVVPTIVVLLLPVVEFESGVRVVDSPNLTFANMNRVRKYNRWLNFMLMKKKGCSLYGDNRTEKLEE